MRFSPKKLQLQRRTAGLRVEHVAVAIDRSAGSIHRYEQGVTIPTQAVVNALADAIGCNPADFYDFDLQSVSS